MLSLHRANQIMGVLYPEIMNIYPLFIQCAITTAVKKTLVKILDPTLFAVYIATEQCSKELLY